MDRRDIDALEAARRAKANSESAARRSAASHAQSHEDTIGTLAREARALAEELAAHGYPRVEVVTVWQPKRWGGRKKTEMGGWTFASLGDGHEGSPATRVHLLSDGTVMVGGQILGGPEDEYARRLLRGHHAEGVLRSLRELRATTITA